MAKRDGKESPDEAIARLYSLSLEDFTSERDALAKRLRSDGNGEAAAEVKGLKKPSVPAWAINQAVRADPAAAKRLVKAGEGLAKAQTAAVKGTGHGDLREAMAAQAEAVEAMMRAVEEATENSSLGAGMLDRARETLRAVAGDDELREQFIAGRLDRDREAVGFGGASAPSAATPKSKPQAKRGKGTGQAKRRREAEQKAKKGERALGVASRRAEEAQSKLERAEAAADDARRRLEDAEHERDARESELSDARAAVAKLGD